ncbi:TonB-dependent receptor [Pedobacter sandarakinus]|uniref:TonB-dependent receptor n=1 Tax=Pedobacter sandarakinus TaxID=353156 RepID=UPI002246B2F3|nr:TonB-dependent receptor [Pedobacter sandarakinus]MCX2573059.1 TonB-dependent receptor [Pedobacter sandarakinus]
MKRTIMAISICLLACFAANAQQNDLSGTVKNINNEGLANVTVQVLNTNISAITDQEGNFRFTLATPGKVRVKFSAVGYATSVIVYNNQPLSVVLAAQDLKLDEVVVSAQKTEEEALRVPASITTFSAQQITNYRIQNTKDLSTLVPNLFSSSPGDGRNVTAVRGIGTTSYDPAIATYIDGVNQFSLDTYIANLFDIERIEVLRGPQGTLYGRNAMGGVINIITKQPNNYTSGFAGVDIGNYNQQRYSIGIRTPIIKDKLFFGAAALFNKQDGFYTNEYNNTKFDNRHSFLGNYYLKFLASSTFDITLNVKHNENRNDGTFPLVASSADALNNPFRLSQNSTAEMVDNLFNASLSANYAGSNFNFNSTSAYQSNYRFYKDPLDGDFSPADIVSVVNNYGKDYNRVQVYTQEFKFTSPASAESKLKWVAGLYGFYQHNPVKQGTYFGNDGALFGAVPNTTAININSGNGIGLAAFGQLTYQLSEKLSATAGLRYDYEHKKLTASGEYLIPGMDPIVTQGDTAARANFNAISPKFSLSYALANQNQLYASYTRGYRAGGITQLASDPTAKPLDSYKPEYSNNIEFGSKNIFFNQRVSLNVAAFYIQVTDAQIPVLILPDALTTTRNAGKLDSKGFDLELSAKPAKGLSVDYNFGYTDATYQSLILVKDGQQVNFDGNRQIFTPQTTSMLAFQYTYDLDKSSHVNLLARGEMFFTGNQVFDLANQIQQKGYSVYNAKVGLTAKKFDLFFWGRNLANETYVDYAYDFGAAHLGNPKTYGISLVGRF